MCFVTYFTLGSGAFPCWWCFGQLHVFIAFFVNVLTKGWALRVAKLESRVDLLVKSDVSIAKVIMVLETLSIDLLCPVV